MKKFALAAVSALMLAGLVPAQPVTAAPPTVTLSAAQAKPCKAHKKPKKAYWVCVTPGSYCPKVARKRYGYAYRTLKKYRCMEYDNGQWRWKRA